MTASTTFFITILPLQPVFDDLDGNPLKTVTDIKTIVGTPTYPINFYVGHEDPALVSTLQLRASSPDTALIQPSGISLSLAASPSGNFVYNQIVVSGRQAQVTIQPTPQGTGTASLTYILTDGKYTVRSTVSVYIIGDRPAPPMAPPAARSRPPPAAAQPGRPWTSSAPTTCSPTRASPTSRTGSECTG